MVLLGINAQNERIVFFGSLSDAISSMPECVWYHRFENIDDYNIYVAAEGLGISQGTYKALKTLNAKRCQNVNRC